MKNLNNYIEEAWSGVKKQSIKQEIEYWCEEMGIQDYTINSKGEIDVNGDVDLRSKNFKELPFKFGRVSGYFDVSHNENLVSLKNCPNYVGGYFSCARCIKLKSLEGCPKEVKGNLTCNWCEELTSLIGCPNYVGGYFSCTGCHNLKSLKGSPMKIGRDFVCYGCSQLDSLEGCPQEVKKDFLCGKCKRKFTKEEVESLCKVKGSIDLI